MKVSFVNKHVGEYGETRYDVTLNGVHIGTVEKNGEGRSLWGDWGIVGGRPSDLFSTRRDAAARLVANHCRREAKKLAEEAERAEIEAAAEEAAAAERVAEEAAAEVHVDKYGEFDLANPSLPEYINLQIDGVMASDAMRARFDLAKLAARARTMPINELIFDRQWEAYRLHAAAEMCGWLCPDGVAELWQTPNSKPCRWLSISLGTAQLPAFRRENTNYLRDDELRVAWIEEAYGYGSLEDNYELPF